MIVVRCRERSVGVTVPILVHYRVPVVAEVEIETGEVLSVHIDDEHVDGPLRVTDDASGEVEAGVRQRAIAIAESAAWPGWTAGW